MPDTVLSTEQILGKNGLSTEKILRQLKAQYGNGLWTDDLLLDGFSCLTRGDLKGANSFLHIFMSNRGYRLFYGLQKSHPLLQQDEFCRFVQFIRDTYYLQEAFVVDMCGTLWRVICEMPAPDYWSFCAKQEEKFEAQDLPEPVHFDWTEITEDTYQTALEQERKEGPDSAFSNFIFSAQYGNAKAQCKVGYMYHTGKGIHQDYQESVKWYQKAADQGNSVAQYNLSICYEFGYGVEKSQEMARYWYAKSAAQGDQDAKKKLE